MEIKEYYVEKRKVTDRLFKQLVEKKLPGQPQVVPVNDEFGDEDVEATKANTSVYVVSVKNRQLNSTPGQVSLAYLNNATRGITDGTHAVATQEQIDEYLKRQDAAREQIKNDAWSNAAKKEIVREVIREVPTPATNSQAKR